MTAAKLHTYGLHGTSARNARQIASAGFRPSDTYIAVGDHQHSMSEKFGVHAASSYDDDEYGIITVSFPALQERFGLDGDYVVVPAEIVASGLLVVRNVLIRPVPEFMRRDRQMRIGEIGSRLSGILTDEILGYTPNAGSKIVGSARGEKTD